MKRQTMIAADMPEFLVKAVQVIDWDSLNFITQQIIIGLINVEVKHLTKKQSNYEAYYIETSVDSKVIDELNIVEYSSVSTSDMLHFETKIKTSFSQYLHIIL